MDDAACKITCPDCGATSYHPDDVIHSYCGRCHKWLPPDAVTSEARSAAKLKKAEMDRADAEFWSKHDFGFRTAGPRRAGAEPLSEASEDRPGEGPEGGR